MLEATQDTTVLVTGGAGYIGSHVVLALHRRGYRVIVLDNLVYGHRDLIEQFEDVSLVIGDTGDRQLLESLFQRERISAVMHFAAYAYVGESVSEPLKYYQNNVASTLQLLEAMLGAGIDKFVFSSTCATYGIPEVIPIPESHPQKPINPYGMSKLMVEKILLDFDQAYDLKSVIFRYFNAAGADPQGKLGEDHTPETHLIPLILQAVAGQRSSIAIFGTDYPTPDGTCIRDYIHVSDLAEAHILGLEYLLKGGSSEIFNLGNGQGFSVREAIQAARSVTGQKFSVEECSRRAGDPPMLVGGSDHARQVLGWAPKYQDLTDIIDHAWRWHQHRHGGN